MTKNALAQVDRTVSDYEIVTTPAVGGFRADVPQYPIIFAIEPTAAEAEAAARECLRQHLASQVKQGQKLTLPQK